MVFSSSEYYILTTPILTRHFGLFCCGSLIWLQIQPIFCPCFTNHSILKWLWLKSIIRRWTKIKKWLIHWSRPRHDLIGWFIFKRSAGRIMNNFKIEKWKWPKFGKPKPKNGKSEERRRWNAIWATRFLINSFYYFFYFNCIIFNLIAF